MLSGGAFFRQRHNNSGYSSSGQEDLEEEDSAASPMAWASFSSSYGWWNNGRWHHIKKLIWVASTAFILYCGDFKSNFISLLLRDSRIRRTALNLGSMFVACEIIILIYLAFLRRDTVKFNNRWQISRPTARLTVAVIGLLAFILLCLALWPIWRVLTLPLLLTLFRVLMLLATFIASSVKRKSASDMFRLDVTDYLLGI